MRFVDIMSELERLAPPALACDWDNPGFLAGRGEKEVRRVLLALDATDEVVAQAVRVQADLLLTHHPLIFKPVKAVNDRNFITRRLVSLIQADICYYAMHTNFDIAPGCMADLAAARLGMEPEAPLEVTGEVAGCPVGVGKIGTLAEPMQVRELAAFVKERFGLPFVTVYGETAVTEPVRRIAVSPGSGGSMVKYAAAAGVPVLVTGDIGHHEGIDAAAEHVAVIDAGHYGLEHIFMPFMEEYLARTFGDQLEVLTAEPAFPAHVI